MTESKQNQIGAKLQLKVQSKWAGLTNQYEKAHFVFRLNSSLTCALISSPVSCSCQAVKYRHWCTHTKNNNN